MPNTIGFHNMGLTKGQFVAGATLEFRTSGHSPKRQIAILTVNDSSNGVLHLRAMFLFIDCEGTYDPMTDSLVLTNQVPPDEWIQMLQGVEARPYVDRECLWGV